MSTQRCVTSICATLASLFTAAALCAYQEPKPLPSEDPLRARSGEAEISFGQIQRDQPMRLDAKNRIAREVGITPGFDAVVPLDLPSEAQFGLRELAPTPPPGTSTPSGIPTTPDPVGAKVDISPVPPVDIGLEYRTTDHGVLVVRVREDSPAHAARVMVNDLIKRVGERAALTQKDIDETLGRLPPLSAVPLEVERAGKKVTLVLNLPSSHEQLTPPSESAATTVALPAKQIPVDPKSVVRDEVVGWSLAEMGEAYIGVRVVAVQPGGPAAQAGLTENDIILGVDGVRCRDVNSVATGVHRHTEGDRVILWVKRGVREGVIAVLVPQVVQVPPVTEVGVAPVVPVIPVNPEATTVLPTAPTPAVPVTPPVQP